MGHELEAIKEKFNNLSALVGNTPLLEIIFLYKGEERKIWAKAEHLNMSGSIKDRMAFHILQSAYIRGILRPGAPIIEATSGNTGIAVATFGRALGHPVTIFMPDWMSQERIDLIRSLGAKIVLVTREQGGFLGSIKMAEELALEQSGFLPSQFSNEHNVEAHAQTTGPELWHQLGFEGARADAFIAGVGTGGTIMGVGRYLRGRQPSIRLHPLEPANSPTLSTGHKVGKHRIQGISDEFIPSIVNLGYLDPVVAVDDGDSILMAQQLATKLGLGVGISSGANFLGALKVQNELGADSVIATVFADDNKKYLSTDLLREEPIKEDFLTPDIELVSYRAIKPTCHTCCDPSTCKQKDAGDGTDDEHFHAACHVREHAL